jgi:TolB-like protein
MLRLTLFGGFSAAGADGVEIPLKSQKARVLLAYLALPPGKSRSREEIMALLWSDRGEAQARASLRQVLTVLRKDLGAQAMKAMIITDDAVSLDPANVTVARAKAGEELLAGLHIHDPAFEEWLRDERLRLEDTATISDQPAGLSAPENPSIAVLPFANMSGDPEQDYFSDGITEDIITELSRFTTFEVVARNSSFAYRDQAIDVSEVGRKLGARYLLEGSLRKVGNRIRLTAQLIDVNTGKHVWAERYDRELEDIFAIQDELVHAIVATLAGRLRDADAKRSLMKPPESLAAYDCYLHALDLDRKFEFESSREVLGFARRAIELDPKFPRGHALLAMATVTVGWFQSVRDRSHEDEVLRIAKTAISLDPQDSFCHWSLGLVYIMRREHDLARDAFERALGLNPHDALVWTDYAWYHICVGDAQKALQLLDEREAVDPMPPNWHWEIRGEALYALGRYADAIVCFERIPNLPYWVHRNLAACHGQLGEVAAAQSHWARVLEAVPDAKPGRHFMNIYATDPAVLEHWYEGLQKAGLEE